MIAESLRQIARENQLNGYEIPRDFLIETEPFSLANGLLSGVGKFLRPKLKARYGDRLEQLYATMADDQLSQLRDVAHGRRRSAGAGDCRSKPCRPHSACRPPTSRRRRGSSTWAAIRCLR